MLATVATIATHNLATGVLTGVALSGAFFEWKVSHSFTVRPIMSEDGAEHAYEVEGQVFFGSEGAFVDAFDFAPGVKRLPVDVNRAHVCDLTVVAALYAVVMKFRRLGAEVEGAGLNKASATIVDRLGVHEKPGAVDPLPVH